MRMHSTIIAATAALMAVVASSPASLVEAHVVRTDPVLPARGGVYSIMVEGQSSVIKPTTPCACQPGFEPISPAEAARIEASANQQCTMPGAALPGKSVSETCRCRISGPWYAQAGAYGNAYVETKDDMCGGQQYPQTEGVMYQNQRLDLFLDMTNAEPVSAAISNVPLNATPCAGTSQTKCAPQFICVDIENDGCSPTFQDDCDGYCKYDPNADPVDVDPTEAPKLKDILKDCIMKNQASIGDALKGFMSKGQTVNNGQAPNDPWVGADKNIGNMVGQMIGSKLPGAAGNAAGTIVSGCVNTGVAGHNGVGNIVETLIGGKKVLGLDVSDLVGGLLGDINGHKQVDPVVDAQGNVVPPKHSTGHVVGTVARTLIGGFLQDKAAANPDNGLANLFSGLFNNRRRRRARALLATACDPVSDPNCGESGNSGFATHNSQWVDGSNGKYNPNSFHDASDNTYYYTPGNYDGKDRGVNDNAVRYEEDCECPAGHDWSNPHENICTIAGRSPSGKHKCRCQAPHHELMKKTQGNMTPVPAPVNFTPQTPRGMFSVHLMCAEDKEDLTPARVRAHPVSGEYLVWSRFMERSIYLTLDSLVDEDSPYHCTLGVFYDGNGNGVCLDFQLHREPLDGGTAVDNVFRVGNNGHFTGVNQGQQQPIDARATSIDAATRARIAARNKQIADGKKNDSGSNTGMIVGLAIGAIVLLIVIITVACLKSSSTSSSFYGKDYNQTFMQGGMYDRSNDYDEFVVNPIRSF